MIGYEYLVRTCFFRWAIGSPYLCCSIYAELLDVQVLGLHLPPCVCGVRFSSVRSLWTPSRDMNVQRSSTCSQLSGYGWSSANDTRRKSTSMYTFFYEPIHFSTASALLNGVTRI